ncbi:serine hydrolase domain-containing protein [Kineococcus rhizosphaerae]|uniref:serine hydrolase domain-containing protein n=1 Tax=Kineococcus rhizosphaerae TaxID=559628 RepID=UPI0014739F2F|nr:serine hydrolase domain-containing protein [Kineococcus rhizosphaerae]
MPAPALNAEIVATAADAAARWIALRRERLQVPGVQLAVRLDGELLHSSAHGSADLERGVALTPQHVFRVASHSKTFTATAVLRLAEQGRLRLDDELGAHLPWVADEDGELGRASLRELLGHAAGVTRDGTAGDFWQLDEEFLDVAGLRTAVRAGGSLVPRSSRFKYSNIGYSLLGLVVEAVTGTSYAAHLSELLAPWGLSRTTPDLPAAGDLATGYSALALGPRRPLPHPATGAMAAATGFCSTAEDLTAWFTSHADGREGPLSEHSRRLAQRAEWRTGPGAGAYGLGFGRDEVGGRELVGHGGGFPGHITRSVLDPRAGLAVSVLTNCVDGPANEFALGVVKLVDLFAEHWSAQVPAVDLDAFCGRWADLWGLTDVVRAGGRLLAFGPDTDDPARSPKVLDVVDARTLRVSDDSGYGDHAETWLLGARADGTPTLRGSSGATTVPLDRYAP